MKDMQLIKTKKRRRKKSEIENEKTIKNTTPPTKIDLKISKSPNIKPIGAISIKLTN